MEMLKNLSSCKDFNRLKKNFSKEMLEMFEKTIEEYENGTSENDGYSILDLDNQPIIIGWYEGLVTTDDLINYYEE